MKRKKREVPPPSPPPKMQKSLSVASNESNRVKSSACWISAKRYGNSALKKEEKKLEGKKKSTLPPSFLLFSFFLSSLPVSLSLLLCPLVSKTAAGRKQISFPQISWVVFFFLKCPSNPATKSHGFLPLRLSITGEVVKVVND